MVSLFQDYERIVDVHALGHLRQGIYNVLFRRVAAQTQLLPMVTLPKLLDLALQRSFEYLP